MHKGPSIGEIRRLRERLGSDIVETPVLRCRALERCLDDQTRVFGKLEFLQRTGTFKARAALEGMPYQTQIKKLMREWVGR